MYQAYDSNLSSRIVFLDKSKAFDRVDHICLIFKLQQLGIDGSLLNLLSSCIFRRSQVVLLGRSRSDLKIRIVVFLKICFRASVVFNLC